MQEKVYIMYSWCGWEIPPLGFVQQGGNEALRPRDGFSHPQQEHIKNTILRYNKSTMHKETICPLTYILIHMFYSILQIEDSRLVITRL